MYKRYLFGVFLFTLGGRHLRQLAGDRSEGRAAGHGGHRGGEGGSSLPREEDLGDSGEAWGRLEQGKEFVLRLHLDGGGGGVELDDRNVFFVDVNFEQELSFQKGEGRVLHFNIKGGLIGVDVNAMKVLIFKLEGWVLEKGGIWGTGVGRQEPSHKYIYLDYKSFKCLRTYVTTIGLLALPWRREGRFMSWIGRGKPKILEKIRPTSDIRSSPLVNGLTLRPLIMMDLRRRCESRYKEIIVIVKHTRSHFSFPVQVIGFGLDDGCQKQSCSKPRGSHGGLSLDQIKTLSVTVASDGCLEITQRYKWNIYEKLVIGGAVSEPDWSADTA